VPRQIEVALRIAIFLNWRSDAFQIVTQARVARTLAERLQASEVVTTVDMSSRLSKPDIDALLKEGILPGLDAGARLANTVSGLSPVPRPIVMDKLPRGVAEMRYNRVDRDPLALDLGVRTPVSIPRDGEVDCKDADLWLTADRGSLGQVFPVRPVVLTFHPLADRLRTTADAEAGFAKRVQYLEAAGVICAPGSTETAVQRFGLDRSRLVEHDFGTAHRQSGGRSVLVIASDAKAEKELLEALSGKDKEPDPSTEVVVATPSESSLDHQGVRVTHVLPGGRRKLWSSYVIPDSFSAAASLLERADAIVLDGAVSESAFAVARWIDEGRLVSIPAADIETQLSDWPNLTSLPLSLAERTRVAIGQLESGR